MQEKLENISNNDYENRIFQILWVAAQAKLMENTMILNAYIRKGKRSKN